MPQLSEPAKKLIEEFERKIENISAEERDEILKRMTSHIFALNEDVKGLFAVLQKDKGRVEGNDDSNENNTGSFRDYI